MKQAIYDNLIEALDITIAQNLQTSVYLQKMKHSLKFAYDEEALNDIIKSLKPTLKSSSFHPICLNRKQS